MNLISFIDRFKWWKHSLKNWARLANQIG